MAKEWYLITSPHSQVSGFESEAFDDYAQEGFIEALDSSLAYDIELCNYDLSVRTPMRAFVQNRVQDTKLNSFWRYVYFPIGTSKAGMYVYYKGRYWIIESLVDDNGMYEKAVIHICNYELCWLNKAGNVVIRWVNISSASQYNNGQYLNFNYGVRTDQLMIIMPDDEESLLLDESNRFIIDKRCKLYERSIGSETVVTSNPVITYGLTRSGNIVYNYVDSGVHELLVVQTEQHDDDGYYVIDGKGYWLCNTPTSKEPAKSKICEIFGEEFVVYAGLGEATFSPIFYDENGNITAATPTWDVKSSFDDSLDVVYIGNDISISTDDLEIINQTFTLTLSSDGYDPVSQTITVLSLL